MRIAVYPDTNAFYSDRFLRKPYSDKFLAALSGDDVRVYLSPLVIDETLRHAREQATERAQKLRGAFRSVRVESAVDATGLETAMNDYTQQVAEEAESALQRLLDHPAVTVIDRPYISPDDLVKRELERKRPFVDKEAGTIGFRDTMIWCSMLEHFDVVSDDHILVITGDKGFLSTDKKSLHDDLLDDLDEFGIERGRVHTQPDLLQAEVEIRRLRKLISEREAVLSAAAISFTQALINAPWGTSHADGAFNRSVVAAPSWLLDPVVTAIEDVSVVSIGDGEWAPCVTRATAKFHGRIASSELLHDPTDATVTGGEPDEWLLDVTTRVPLVAHLDIEYDAASSSATIQDYRIEADTIDQ